MAADGHLVSLEQAVNLLSGGTPPKSVPQYWGGTIPWASAKDMTGPRLRDTEDHITEAGLESRCRLAPIGATLVLVRGMTLLTDIPICTLYKDMAFNQDIKALLPKQALDGKYLTYTLLCRKKELLNMVELAGHGTGRLPTDRLKSLQIKLPPIHEQLAIVHILGTLDDKIELNRQMNKTLEGIARTMFKSWFVDFDPVRAKADGRDPGLPKEIADLFPNSFRDSELGQIPEKWGVTRLGEITDVIDCLQSKKPERRPSGKPLLQLWNVRDDGLMDTSDTYFIDESDYRMWVSRMEASPGDCVVTNVGRVGAVAQVPRGLNAALGRNMTGIRCKKEFPFPTFLIECLLSEAMRSEIILKTDTGTILDALNVRSIPELRIVKPSVEISRVFEGLSRPLRARMERNLVDCGTLASLRDTLLPKLISGELRIPDAETVAGRHA